jgi:hypothetical protein
MRGLRPDRTNLQFCCVNRQCQRNGTGSRHGARGRGADGESRRGFGGIYPPPQRDQAYEIPNPAANIANAATAMPANGRSPKDRLTNIPCSCHVCLGRGEYCQTSLAASNAQALICQEPIRTFSICRSVICAGNVFRTANPRRELKLQEIPQPGALRTTDEVTRTTGPRPLR